jgi:hypothetical protein
MEAKANAFNLKCLAVLCGVTLLCALCNRIGVFKVEARIMKIAVIQVYLIDAKLHYSSPSAII